MLPPDHWLLRALEIFVPFDLRDLEVGIFSMKVEDQVVNLINPKYWSE